MPNIQIQQGDTLSKIARQRGTTVANLQRLNPQITNPDLIQAGATLNVEDSPVQIQGSRTQAKPVGVVDTEKVRKRVRQAQRDVEDLETRERPRRRERQRTTLEDTLFDLEEIGQEQEDQFQNFADQLEAARTGAIPFTADEEAQLEGIRGSFDALAKEQARLNRQREGFQTRIAGRTGRSRFAPEIAEQEISEKVQEGIDKLGQINIQAESALAAQKQAFRDKNFREILQSNDALNQALNQRKSTIKDVQNSILAINQEQRAQQKEMRDQKLFDLTVQERGLDIAIKGKKLDELTKVVPTGTLTKDQIESLGKNKTAEATTQLISVNNLLQQYQDMIAADLSPGRKGRKKLNAFVTNVIAPSLAVAQGQGAMTDDERKAILDDIGVSALKREIIPIRNIDSISQGIQTKIDTNFDFIDSSIPGASDNFGIFADYKFNNLSPEEQNKQLVSSTITQFSDSGFSDNEIIEYYFQDLPDDFELANQLYNQGYTVDTIVSSLINQ